MSQKKTASSYIVVRILALGALVFSMLIGSPRAAQAALVAGFSEYFIPGFSDDLMAALEDIEISNDNTAPYNNGIGDQLTNITTVSIGGNVTLYYDHWENGYSTGAAGDETFSLTKGQVITFRTTNIPEPRGTSQTCTGSTYQVVGSGAVTTNNCYDGRDRLYVVGGAVSVAQAYWPTNANTNYANAWEIYPVKPYQTSYIIPVGENMYGPTYWDRFSAQSYSNTDGTTNWSSTPWVESGADSGGSPTAGTTWITGGRLRFEGSAAVSNLSRPVNLGAPVTDAYLSFDYFINDTIEAGDTLAIQVSTNGGGTWTTLNTMTGGNGNFTTGSGSRSFDLGGYLNANTQIRFAVTGFTNGTEYLELDNVKIRYTTTTDGANSVRDFLNVFVFVQSTADGTTIQIDDPQTSGVEVNVTRNKGETVYLGHTFAGTTVNASAPVQVQFLIGEDIVVTGQNNSRSYTAVPSGLWSTTYYSPVPGDLAGVGAMGYQGPYRTDIYIYNPSASALTINYEDSSGSGTFSVAAGATEIYSDAGNAGHTVPVNSGVYLAANDGVTKFWAIGAVDASDPTWNWGFTLLPVETLTDEYFVSWAPGGWNQGTNQAQQSDYSPIYVTPVQDNTTIFVDYSPADGTVDAIYTLDRIQIVKIYDQTAPGHTQDADNTGTHIWATGPIALAWGQDPDASAAASPGLDAGYTILPMNKSWIDVVLDLEKTADPAIIPDLSGQTSVFTLVAETGDYAVEDVTVTDTLPANWSYVSGSTTITLPDGSTISGASADPDESGQDLVWDEFPSGALDMAANQALTIEFTAITTAAPGGVSINNALATGTYGGITLTADDFATVDVSALEIEKISSAGGTVAPGDTITYTILITNTGTATQNNIVVSDTLPAGTTYVANSTHVTFPVQTLSGTAGDAFNAIAFTGNQDSNGVADPSWVGSGWQEVGESDGADAEDVRVLADASNYQLRLRDNDNGGEGVLRDVDISSCDSAVLSFDYRRNALDDANDYVRLSIGTGGTLTDSLQDFAGPDNDATYQSYSVDITNWIDAQTRIQLLTSPAMGGTDNVYFDNVLVSCYNTTVSTSSGNAPPNLVDATDDYDLAAGGVMTVTFQVTVDDPVPAGQTSVINTVAVSSDEEPTPLKDTVIDILGDILPLATIGNRVWIDENADGVQNPGEPGLPNVIVELYDSTGVTLLDSVVTDLNGNYLFPDLASGTYQVRVNAASLPSGLSVSTLGTAGADFNNQAQPYTVSVGDGENMTADFGYNWAPAANVSGNTGTGAIGDRVWVDADGDGLQDPGEPGLNGITVRLLTDDNGDGVYGSTGDNPAVTTTTDAAGNYIFTGLAAGSYIVEANDGSAPSGYTQTGDPDAACPGTGCDNRTTQPLVLAPGDVYLNADFGYQPTGASGTIGNTVWFNPDGNATLDTGEYGLPGVTVALIQDANGNGAWDAGEPVIATDITDGSGNYSFSGLPLDDGDGDADYLVWVNDTDNVLGELVPNYDADGLGNPASGLETTGVSAVALSTGSPANNSQDFGYGPDPINPAEVGVIGDTIFLDRNGNGAFDPGEGLENVEVELLDNLGTLIAYTRTDENGHYAFGGLADGTYTIRVAQSTLPNGGTGLTNSVDPDTASPGDNESSVILAAGSRINLDQDFGYVDSNPGTIGGTLWTDTDADGTLDGSESGRFSGVTVALLDADGDVVATTTTGGNGDYSFLGLPAGTYYVHVTDADNLLDGYWQSPDVAPGTDGNSQSDPYAVVLAAGGSNTTADFGYYRVPASLGDFVWEDLDQDGIQDPGEPGLAGIVVSLTISYPNGTIVTLVDVTDSDGAYTFDNLLLDEDFDGAGAGEPTYVIAFATPSGYTPSPANQGGDDTADSDGTSVTVVPLEGQDDTTIDSGFYAVVEIGDRIWLDLNSDGVQDSNEPGLAGVIVELSNGTCTVGVDCLTATTDANGNYTFANLPGGNYTVVVRASSLPGGVVQTGDPDATFDNQHTLTTVAPDVYLDVDFGYRGTGSISNFVWNDLDGDGVQDTGEGGIGGVSVWVDLNNDGVQDPTEPSDVTDANGQYYIGGLPAGTYTVRTGGAPISGATPTYDLDGTGTANVASVVLGAGENRTDVDWGYQFAVLDISKTSSAGGTVNPGDTITYTIVVQNNTASQQTNIAITDPLPSGTTYVAQSTVANGYTFTSNYARDEFSSQSYSRQDGDGILNWAGDWVENDPYGYSGPTGNYVGITGGRLFLHWAYVNDERIERSVDLSTYSSAELSFDWQTVGIDPEECVAIRIYNGSSWTTLTTFTGSHSDSYTVDITSYMSNDTRVRFANEDSCNANWESGEYAYFDNVQITATAAPTAVTLDNAPGAPNPDLVNGTPANLVVAGDGFALDPGQQMQVTYQVTVDDPVQEASIDNTASVISTQQPDPQESSTSDVLSPSSLGDYVWLDRDNDGIQDADEPGIRGVPVTLTITYPDGTETFETVTGADGYYSFDDLFLNEAYTTAGATFSLSFETPPGAVASPVEQGGDPAADSNGATTTAAPFYQGQTDITYDSGFYTTRLDLGDLPDTYHTLFSPGPAHIVFPDANADYQPESSGDIPAVWLGTTVDVESNGNPGDWASGDDGTAFDDEDGLILPEQVIPGDTASFIVTINASESLVRVYFGMWIDWDTDGAFDAFYAGSGVSGSPTNVPVTVDVPATYIPGTRVYIRVRAADFALSGSDSTGTILNGEVEDYREDWNPTAVTFAAFEATPQDGAALVTWETAMELNNVGFNLYRSTAAAGPYTQLNATLIPPQFPGEVMGGTYEWLDRDVQSGVTYFYKLEDIDVNGVHTFHGPVSTAVVTAPTAVELQNVSARNMLLIPALGLLFAGLTLVKRRR